MKFLADEGVDAAIVEELRNGSFDVVYVAEMEPGTSDDIILEKARTENRMLLTQDKDFGELVFRMGMIHAGVILIRLHGLSTDSKTKIVVAALERIKAEILSAFVVIQPGAIRIRKKEDF